MNILEKIRDDYSRLTKKQKSIADYLLSNPEDICYITLSQLSRHTGASEVTVLRFCRQVGCGSFLDLKSQFREYTQQMIRQLSSSAYFVPEQASSSETEKEAQLLNICRMEADAMLDFFENFQPDAIASAAAEIKRADRIFIFAHDISQIPAEFLNSRLQLLYLNSQLTNLSDLAVTQQRLQQLTDKDMVIFFSFPKYYYPMGSIAKKAAEAGAAVLTITDSISSPAAKYSSQLLLCQTATEVFYNTMTMPMALVNLLASWLVIDTVPASERKDFRDTLSS